MATRRSPRPRGPQARGELTRERILEAVLEQVARGGSRAVTYRAVADRAGVTQGVMTYHFGSRRELVAEAFKLHLRRQRDEARALPLDRVRALSTAARARLVFGFLQAMVRDNRARQLAELELTLELARDPELRAEVVPETDVTRDFARRLLEATGSPQPAEDAILVSAVMEGLALEWLARPDDRGFERKLRGAVARLVELFFPKR